MRITRKHPEAGVGIVNGLLGFDPEAILSGMIAALRIPQEVV